MKSFSSRDLLTGKGISTLAGIPHSQALLVLFLEVVTVIRGGWAFPQNIKCS